MVINGNISQYGMPTLQPANSPDFWMQKHQMRAQVEQQMATILTPEQQQLKAQFEQSLTPDQKIALHQIRSNAHRQMEMLQTGTGGNGLVSADPQSQSIANSACQCGNCQNGSGTQLNLSA